MRLNSAPLPVKAIVVPPAALASSHLFSPSSISRSQAPVVKPSVTKALHISSPIVPRLISGPAKISTTTSLAPSLGTASTKANQQVEVKPNTEAVTHAAAGLVTPISSGSSAPASVSLATRAMNLVTAPFIGLFNFVLAALGKMPNPKALVTDAMKSATAALSAPQQAWS